MMGRHPGVCSGAGRSALAVVVPINGLGHGVPLVSSLRPMVTRGERPLICGGDAEIGVLMESGRSRERVS
jgi:hypothetical protein